MQGNQAGLYIKLVLCGFDGFGLARHSDLRLPIPTLDSLDLLVDPYTLPDQFSRPEPSKHEDLDGTELGGTIFWSPAGNTELVVAYDMQLSSRMDERCTLARTECKVDSCGLGVRRNEYT